jgi:hypothetical protein
VAGQPLGRPVEGLFYLLRLDLDLYGHPAFGQPLDGVFHFLLAFGILE